MIGPRISSHGVQQTHVQATSGQSRRIVPLHHAPAPRVKRARSRSTVASRSLLPREPLQGCIVCKLALVPAGRNFTAPWGYRQLRDQIHPSPHYYLLVTSDFNGPGPGGGARSRRTRRCTKSKTAGACTGSKYTPPCDTCGRGDAVRGPQRGAECTQRRGRGMPARAQWRALAARRCKIEFPGRTPVGLVRGRATRRRLPPARRAHDRTHRGAPADPAVLVRHGPSPNV